MDASKIEYYKNILLNKRVEVLNRIETLREVTVQNSYQEGTRDTAAYASHMADQGTDAMEREKAFLFLSREEKYLQQVNQALKRIEMNEYGVCRVCEKEIDQKRLEIVPTTRICVPCKMQESKR